MIISGPNNIKAILFDYGGVLAEQDFCNTLEALVREHRTWS